MAPASLPAATTPPAPLSVGAVEVLPGQGQRTVVPQSWVHLVGIPWGVGLWWALVGPRAWALALALALAQALGPDDPPGLLTPAQSLWIPVDLLPPWWCGCQGDEGTGTAREPGWEWMGLWTVGCPHPCTRTRPWSDGVVHRCCPLFNVSA